MVPPQGSYTPIKMVRRVTLLALAVALTAFTLTPRVTAEQATAVTSRTNAEKSYRGGRYDEVETIAKAFPKDEQIAVLHALGVAARGDYAKAESILQPFATASARRVTRRTILSGVYLRRLPVPGSNFPV